MMESDTGVSLRQVKLKVLYTFDLEHKNNHLARWPHTIEVQSAQLDETNIVGCIDLRTCLEAVTNASPELTSNTDNDFTVYAYDYSEPDTPLVGQGMLSRAMVQESDAETDNEAMVTGRITKNVMGLFSKNAQETLEVKLRFTPMAGSGQRRRSGSISSNADVVQSHWNSLSQSNGAFRPSSPMDTSGLEAMQRMLSEGGLPRERPGSVHVDSFHSQNQYSSRPGSRAGTPVQSQQLNPPARPSALQSRPSSRNEIRPSSHARRDSFNSGYYSGEEALEEGPARKRARVEKVCHPSKSNLNIERQPDSLRVAASTASSVRLHRPVAFNPVAVALQNNNLGDEPVRPPTPIPSNTKTGRPRGRPRKVVSANLLRGPKPRNSSPNEEVQQQQTDLSLSSPEDMRADSTTSTPADLPSSPPVMSETQNLVTSPQLPPFLNEADSGFMSGCLEDLFGEESALLDFNEFLHDKPLEGENFQNHSQCQRDSRSLSTSIGDGLSGLPPVFDENNDPERTVTEMEPPPPPPPLAPRVPVLSKANSFTSNHRPIIPAPRLAPILAPKSASGPKDSRLQGALPQVPASDPVGRTFQRSHTWAPDMSDAIMSDAVTSDEQVKAKPRKRVGKEQTKARLENAIASGEMPPFCDNCGTIETPAWRRAYSKVFECPWEELETSLEPGECCYKEPLEHDANGNIIKFKGYKSERRSDEKSSDGWTQICLCNPCGLWFHKSKFPRPPEKWQKKDPNDKKKKKRKSKSRKKVILSKSMTRSDAVTPTSDDSSPADTTAEGGDTEEIDDGLAMNGDEANDDDEPELPPLPCHIRGGSAGPMDRGLKRREINNLKHADRRIRSSPIRPSHGRFDVIEIDLTPKPVQRQLFPSPQSLKNKYRATSNNSDGESTGLPGFVRRSPRLNKVRDAFATPLEHGALVAVGDEENLAPTTSHDDLNGLFSGDIDDVMPPPSTPQRRSGRLLFKTPSKTPSREFGENMSPNIQRTPTTRRTPRQLQSVTSKLTKELHMASNPVDMTPFSRSIYESIHGNEMAPLNQSDTPQKGSSGRVRKTPKRVSAKDVDSLFDFPDLPSLQNSSPMGVDLMQAFAFSEMTTDQLHPDFNDFFSTDLPMPSSPPQGYFDYAINKDDQIQNSWSGTTLQDKGHSTYPCTGDTELLCATANEKGGLRRSPRKHAA